MLVWIIQISFISIILIFLVHHLIGFFKSTLTVPKIKDLVNSSNQKYQKIYDTISSSSTTNSNSTSIDLLPILGQPGLDQNILRQPGLEQPILDSDNMKNELKSFLKKQLHNTEINAF